MRPSGLQKSRRNQESAKLKRLLYLEKWQQKTLTSLIAWFRCVYVRQLRKLPVCQEAGAFIWDGSWKP